MRLNVFLEGFDVESDDIDVAYANGETYVKRIRSADVSLVMTNELHSPKLGIYFEEVPNSRRGANRLAAHARPRRPVRPRTVAGSNV